MEYKKVTETKAYKELMEGKKADLKELLSAERIEKSNIKLGGGSCTTMRQCLLMMMY